MNDADRRRLLSVSFETYEDGYLYYRNRWSGGVRVSAEEREQFISSSPAGAFSLGRKFAKRPAIVPPRYYNPWSMVDAMPLTFAGGLATVAMAAAAEANQAVPLLSRTVLFSVAVFMAAMSVTIIGRRIAQRIRH
jgi:hypothetical protein